MKTKHILPLAAALVLAACSQPWWQEGDFTAAGATFTPADPALSQKLDPKAYDIRAFSSKGGVRHYCKHPSRVGSHRGMDISIVTSMSDGFLADSYYVTLITNGNGVSHERKVCEGQTCYVTTYGDIHKLTRKAALPEDWICLATLEGQKVFLAWNPKAGGENEVFTAAQGSPAGAAVYKRLTQTPCDKLFGPLSDCSGYTQLSDGNRLHEGDDTWSETLFTETFPQPGGALALDITFLKSTSKNKKREHVGIKSICIKRADGTRLAFHPDSPAGLEMGHVQNHAALWSPDGRHLLLPLGDFEGYLLVPTEPLTRGETKVEATRIKVVAGGSAGMVCRFDQKWVKDDVFRFTATLSNTDLPMEYDISHGTGSEDIVTEKTVWEFKTLPQTTR